MSRWISGTSAASLFIPYRAGQIQALRSLIAAWMRLAIFEAMHGEEGADQRLWFVIDELDALGAIDGLKDALARLAQIWRAMRALAFSRSRKFPTHTAAMPRPSWRTAATR